MTEFLFRNSSKSALQEIQKRLNLYFSKEILNTEFDYDEFTITINSTSIVRILKFLRDDTHCLFKQLIDICGVDYPERDNRFEVVYHLLSIKHNTRIRVKSSTNEENPIPSCNTIFSAAAWFEREAWDLFGILFSNHPDLRRILTDYGFEGHPLRKDFPLTGYVEVKYDSKSRRVVYENVKLPQDFRNFDFESPWEGMSNAILDNENKGVQKK